VGGWFLAFEHDSERASKFEKVLCDEQEERDVLGAKVKAILCGLRWQPSELWNRSNLLEGTSYDVR
jgi:hypothetical protein